MSHSKEWVEKKRKRNLEAKQLRENKLYRPQIIPNKRKKGPRLRGKELERWIRNNYEEN